MKILVIYGGFGLSSEAEISKESGLEIARACKQAGYNVDEFELNKNNIDLLMDKVNCFGLVFPVLHGEFGEDGSIQKMLEAANVKFIGSGSISSEICFDKIITKKLLDSNNILTPKWKIIKKSDDLKEMKLPLVLKPIKGGSSIGVNVVISDSDLQKINFNQLLLGEEYIQGQELTVAILGEEALPVIEIIPPNNHWFDYKNKYNGKAKENVPPKFISDQIQKSAQELALMVHRLCGCRHLSRVDMILKDGRLYVLEINTMPGMTIESLYPKAAKAAGLDMKQLVNKLVLG